MSNFSLQLIDLKKFNQLIIDWETKPINIFNYCNYLEKNNKSQTEIRIIQHINNSINVPELSAGFQKQMFFEMLGNESLSIITGFRTPKTCLKTFVVPYFRCRPRVCVFSPPTWWYTWHLIDDEDPWYLKHLPKRFVWYVGHIRCMHARPHRRKTSSNYDRFAIVVPARSLLLFDLA